MNRAGKMRLGVILLLLAVGGGLSLGVNASDKESERGGRAGRDVVPVEDGVYRAECGSCHFAYQAGLLPARSWEKLLQGLGDHFGENAELDAVAQSAVRDYLTANAADRVDSGRSRKIVASIDRGEVPLRITATRYFRHKHGEIPRRMWEGNPGVGSLIRCESCHERAESGSFAEREVRIPGVGRWED